MLNPSSRQIYLDELRPPVGYTLDRAIATTYSLDLMTLLMAPLSMALNDCRDRQTALKDPIAVMEALKQTADKFLVFCQEGRIQVPSHDQILYRYLEPLVLQVRPPAPNGVFHAKTWLMRFVSQESDKDVCYRFLCLSRNLTFDRSWDTILTLDGELGDRETPRKENEPLVEFYNSLPKMATKALPGSWPLNMESICQELQRVRFEPPEGFEQRIRFWPIGIPSRKRSPKIEARSRMLIVSPFLSDSIVQTLAQSGKKNVLISRLESLDALAATTITQLRKNVELFVLEDGADASDVTQEDSLPTEKAQEQTSDEEPSEFSGLHAKLYILEDGVDATVLSGSVNATSAGLQGQNVELLVELKGPRRQVGVEAFLGDGDKTSFRSLLRQYPGQGRTDAELSIERQLEQALDVARRMLARIDGKVIVSPADPGPYSLQIVFNGPMQLEDLITVVCYPISLQRAAARNLCSSTAEQTVIFPAVSMLGLTGFIAVELTAQKAGKRKSLSFVLNMPIEGLPPDRDRRIIHDVINNSDKFMRYLMLILCGDELLVNEVPSTPRDGQGANSNSSNALAMLPLLEEMIRALSRQPEKIDRIAKLVKDIQDTPEGNSLFPANFLTIWNVLLAARQERVNA